MATRLSKQLNKKERKKESIGRNKNKKKENHKPGMKEELTCFVPHKEIAAFCFFRIIWFVCSRHFFYRFSLFSSEKLKLEEYSKLTHRFIDRRSFSEISTFFGLW